MRTLKVDRFSLFWEMARQAEERQPILTPSVIAYLKEVMRQVNVGSDEELAKKIISGALQVLYRQEIINSDNPPPTIDVKFETQHNGQKKIDLKNIPVDIDEIKEDLESKHLEMNSDVGRIAAKRIAGEVVEYLAGRSSKVPAFNFSSWEVDYPGVPSGTDRANQYIQTGWIMPKSPKGKWRAKIDGQKFPLVDDDGQSIIGLDPPLPNGKPDLNGPKATQAKAAFRRLLAQHSPEVRPQTEEDRPPLEKLNNLIDKGILKFDADDIEYITYFKTNELPTRDGSHKAPKGKFIREAMRRRMSAKLVEDPQARESKDGGEPGQFYDMEFPWKGRTYVAKNVPVNAGRLRQRLVALRDQHGVNLLTKTSFPVSTMMRWLNREKHHSYKSLASGEGEGVKLQYHQQRESEMLDGLTWNKMDNGELPDEWIDQMEDDARKAVLRAIQNLKGLTGHQNLDAIYEREKDSDAGVHTNLIQAFLLSDQMVDNANYKTEDWRITQAATKARTAIKKELVNVSKAQTGAEFGNIQGQEEKPTPDEPNPITRDDMFPALQRFITDRVLDNDKEKLELPKGETLSSFTNKALNWWDAEKEAGRKPELGKLWTHLRNLILHPEPAAPVRAAAEKPVRQTVSTEPAPAPKAPEMAPPPQAQAPAPKPKKKRAAPPPPRKKADDEPWVQGSLF